MTKIPVVCEHVSEKRHGIPLEILNFDVLWDETCQRVDNGAIADFLVEMAIGLVPFVGVDLQNGFHENLRPELHEVAGSGEDWHSLVITWDAIVDLNEAFLAHEAHFDPIFATWRDNRHVVLLRVDSLPNELV